jgi:hypothetical protein
MHSYLIAHNSPRWTKQDRTHFGLATAGIALAGAFFVYALRPTAAQRFDEAGCRCGSQPRSRTVILVDNTDPFSPQQIAAFRDYLTKARSEVPQWGMLRQRK